MACLNISGKMPVLRLKLQMRAIGPASTATPFFHTKVGISSTPVALVFFNFFMIRVTDPGVTNLNWKTPQRPLASFVHEQTQYDFSDQYRFQN